MDIKLKLLITTFLGALSACSAEDTIPEGDPAKYVKAGTRGYDVRNGVIAGKKEKVYWMQQVVSGYDAKNYSQEPKKLSLIEPHKGCNFKRPTGEHSFMNGSTYTSTAYSTIYSFNQEVFYKRAKSIVKRMQKGTPASAIVMAPKRLKGEPVVDVVITASAKPVYLVLNSGSPVIWNFHMHKDVEIAQVVILSQGETGVANLDENVPLTILDSKGLKRCKILPARKPAEHWDFVKKYRKNSGSNIFKETYNKNVKRSKKYNSWFIKQFGYGFETNIVGLNQTNHLVFGPIPTTLNSRVPYNNMQEANVRVTPNDHILKGSKNQAREYFKQTQIKTIKVSHANLLSN